MLLSSASQRTAAAEILSKVLRNIVEHPTESKYRYRLLLQGNYQALVSMSNISLSSIECCHAQLFRIDHTAVACFLLCPCIVSSFTQLSRVSLWTFY